MNNTEPTVEITHDEVAALGDVWSQLSILFTGAMSRLDRTKALSLCAGIETGAFAVNWSMRPGYLRCAITDREARLIHAFDYQCETPKFHFTELGPEN